MRQLAFALLCTAPLLTAADPAAQWPQWRGPLGSGSAPHAQDLPVEWTAETNLTWKAKLPSWSAATPIVWGDTVFVTSAEEGFSPSGGYKRGSSAHKQTADAIFLIALSTQDGSEKWRRQIGEGNRIYRKHNLASPSPVTDGRAVWVMTGRGELSAYSMSGKQLWKRNLQADYGTFGLNHGYGSSPLLHGGRLYIQVLHGMKTDDPSYVLAIDKLTGKTVWRIERPTDADFESPDDYSTPLVIKVEGKEQLVVSGGDYVTGHDLASGEEVWRMGGFNPNHERFYRTIASSIFVDGILYTTSTRGKPFLAFRPGGRGDITRNAKVWKNDGGSDVPTPTTDGTLVYVVNDRGIATAYDPKSGTAVWGPERLEPGTYSASPLLADGKLYAINEEGTTTVFRAGPQFEILGVNKLNSHTLASPAAVGRRLYIRTAEHLYAIERQ